MGGIDPGVLSTIISTAGQLGGSVLSPGPEGQANIAQVPQAGQLPQPVQQQAGPPQQDPLMQIMQALMQNPQFVNQFLPKSVQPGVSPIGNPTGAGTQNPVSPFK